jgi:hypothetical protein
VSTKGIDVFSYTWGLLLSYSSPCLIDRLDGDGVWLASTAIYDMIDICI